MKKITSTMERVVAWTWKALLVLAVAVPIAFTLFLWHQRGFKTPMPKAVLDSATANSWLFSISILLIVVSFVIQYFFGSPATRKHEIRTRTPILIFIGPIVVLAISLMAWWQSGVSFVDVVYRVVQKPLMLSSVFGLAVGSIVLAFFMSTRELQKRFLRVFVTLVSVALMFGGPSYLIYGLQVVKVSYTIAVVIGLVSFVVGIFLFLRFAPKET